MGATTEYMREYREKKRTENRASEIGEEAAEYERFLVNRWFHGPASAGINNTKEDVKILESFVEEDLRGMGFLKNIPTGEYKCLH